MTDFHPASSILIHASSHQNEASEWLRSLYGDTPWEGSRHSLPVSQFPEIPYPADAPTPKSCLWPKWRQHHLLVWRDQSAVILVKSPDKWNALPAVLYLAPEILASGHRPAAKGHPGPNLRLRPCAKGIGWSAHQCTTSQNDVREMLGEEVKNRAAEITQADPIIDPRAGRAIGRIPPFAPLRGEDSTWDTRISEMLTLVACLADVEGILIHQQPPNTPWHSHKPANTSVFIGLPTSQRIGMFQEWSEWLNRTAFGTPGHPGFIPANYIIAPTKKNVRTWSSNPTASYSAHEQLKARHKLIDLVGAKQVSQMPLR